jgi:exodeoxyribonuclease V alpha subunit
MSNLMKKISLLQQRNILQEIDLELYRFFKEHHQEASEQVLLAACLVSYLFRQGDVCLLLEKYASEPLFDEIEESTNLEAPELQSWKEALQESPLVGAPGEFKPLILDEGGRLYLHKLWHYERSLAEQLIERSTPKENEVDIDQLKNGLDRLFLDQTDNEVDWQRVAAAASVRNQLSIISGGPGTGKTSTVVCVMALLLEQFSDQERGLNIALSAPTGKAAARLKDSITSAKQDLNVSEEVRRAIPDETMTLHQLLGARRHTSSFRFDEENLLPYDIVVVDEASMVDQALMSKLINALLEDTQLILLGDKDQLASVEAGSVLGDICNLDQNQFSKEMARWLAKLDLSVPEEFVTDASQPLTDHIALLTKSYRFGRESGIAQLAESVNIGDSNRAIEVLESDTYSDVSLNSVQEQSDFEDILNQKVISYVQNILESNSVDEALDVFERFCILSPHRRGPRGVEFLNRYVEKILQQQALIPKYEQWYPGRPVIVNTNDYTLRLHNGDTGICLPDEKGQLKVYFRHQGQVRGIAPGRLHNFSTAFALTVHKSQGSEFEEVFIVLPSSSSKVLSRELIYTAITRARTDITILGSQSILKQSISKKIQRSSGLKDQLWST